MNRKEIWRPVVGYEGLYDVSNLGNVRSLNYGKTGKVKLKKLSYDKDGYLRVNLYKNGKQKNCSVHRLVWEAFVGPIPDGYELDHINTVRDDARLENLRCVTSKGNANNQVTRKRNLEAMKRLHADPEFMKKHAEAMKRLHADQEFKKNHAEAMKKLWSDPEHRKKQAEACRKRSLDDDWRRNHAEGSKKKWSDPEFRKKQAEATRKANSKPVLQIDKTTGCCIGKWDSMSDVERELGIHNSMIASCCKGKQKTAGGYKWKYA